MEEKDELILQCFYRIGTIFATEGSGEDVRKDLIEKFSQELEQLKRKMQNDESNKHNL